MAISESVVEQPVSCALTQLTPREVGVILRIEEVETKTLHYLATLGLVPGATLQVEDHAPFGGPLLVRLGRARYALGHDLAAKILVGVHC